MRIPNHWTPQQARDLLDLLGDLADAIWDEYDDRIVPLILADLEIDSQPEPPDPTNPEDDIPF